ncbi:hypothetical protein [Phytohabitans flavus]|uniref:hypothetical protein n=1 Tax=Phytohabitans flavus TaxID=1076124 RepID=UPI001567B26F|nr:hypothetical protein [Phytohabitans flavus]
MREQMEKRDGGPLVSADRESAAFDGVELKSVDPEVALGKLVAFAMDTEYSSGLVDNRLIWPEGGEQDTGHMGPWVVTLDDKTRDTLAGVPARRVPDLARRWADIEEFGGLLTPDDLRSALEQLTALATRARDNGESLYCWMCL